MIFFKCDRENCAMEVESSSKWLTTPENWGQKEILGEKYILCESCLTDLEILNRTFADMQLSFLKGK